jgi:hypothetical protein
MMRYDVFAWNHSRVLKPIIRCKNPGLHPQTQISAIINLSPIQYRHNLEMLQFCVNYFSGKPCMCINLADFGDLYIFYTHRRFSHTIVVLSFT